MLLVPPHPQKRKRLNIDSDSCSSRFACYKPKTFGEVLRTGGIKDYMKTGIRSMKRENNSGLGAITKQIFNSIFSGV